jgi:hypothetical protein
LAGANEKALLSNNLLRPGKRADASLAWTETVLKIGRASKFTHAQAIGLKYNFCAPI